MLSEIMFTGKALSRAVCGHMLTDAALITILALVAISEYVSYTANVILKAEHIDNGKLHFQTIRNIFGLMQHLVIHEKQSMHTYSCK